MNKYWIAIAAIACLLAGFAGGYKYRSDIAEKEQAQAEAEYNVQIVEKTKALREDISTITSKYIKEQSDAEKTIKDLRNRIADGSLRLSVRTKNSVPGHTTDGPAAGRTELDAADAQAILDIAATGDSWGRQLNQCIGQYNTVREKYNADTRIVD